MATAEGRSLGNDILALDRHYERGRVDSATAYLSTPRASPGWTRTLGYFGRSSSEVPVFGWPIRDLGSGARELDHIRPGLFAGHNVEQAGVPEVEGAPLFPVVLVMIVS